MDTKTKDNLLYLGIAFGVLILVVGPLVYSIVRGEEIPAFPLKPVWLVASTILLVGYASKELGRRQLKNRRVLLIISCAVALHVALTGVILHSVARVPLLLLALGVFVEAQVILQVTDRLAQRPHKPRV